MTLRELMIERILFAMNDEELQEEFHTSEEELKTMSDEDFLDIYDELFMFQG
jgi:hypothetical protein